MWTLEILDLMRNLMSIKKQGQEGFTLIETIVAIIIITTGLLMLAHLMMVSIVMHERSESDLKSVQLAQGKMETLKAQFSNYMNSGDLPGDLAAGFHGPESVMISTEEYDTQNYLYFNLSWSVTDMTGGAKQITLSVDPASNQTVDEGQQDNSFNTVSITSVLAP